MTTALRHRDRWQQELIDAVRDPAELLELLQLPEHLAAGALAAADDFRLVVPRGFVDLMERGKPDDPLLRQVLPLGEELVDVPGFVSDPLQEQPARQAPGLIRKYHGRVLLITAGQCAINCRYCFRREYPYEAEPGQIDDWQPALEKIRQDRSVNEVILSGGDPLLVSDRNLRLLLAAIADIPHVTLIRIHSRLPVVLPARVTEDLVATLTGTRLQPVLVVHSNHPRELGDACRTALSTLVRRGVVTLNQSVLLRGINDDADVLIDLSRQLTGLGVLPYYLHRLDHVRGTAHFDVPTDRGVELIDQMRRSLPGYAVPRFVVEEPGAEHKTVIA